MSFADTNLYLLVLVTLSAATGITEFFVASLVATASVFAYKKKGFAIACILFFPLTIVNCFLNYKYAKYGAPHVFSVHPLFCITLTLGMWVL